MAQMMRAILFASATAATFFGLRASNFESHGTAWPFLPRRPFSACWITAVAPSTSNRRKPSSPSRLILPSRCLPPVEFSRGVIPIHAAKCRAERKPFGSGTLRAKLTPPIGPTPGIVARHLAGLVVPMPGHQPHLDRLQPGLQSVELCGQHTDHLARQLR